MTTGRGFGERELESAAIPPILSSRLKLVSLPVECLKAMSVGDAEGAQVLGGFIVAEGCLLLNRPHLQRRIEMIAEDPEQHPWMDRAIVTTTDNVMVGYISFHHKVPDPDLLQFSERAVELGYGIDANQRRKGYARESAVAMIGWAIAQGADTFCLSISPRNIPSLRMAESMGFRMVSERMDDADGLEFVWIVSIADIRRAQERRGGGEGSPTRIHLTDRWR